jgi:hypothetical protein
VFAAIRVLPASALVVRRRLLRKDKTMKDWIVPPVVIPFGLALAILAVVLLSASG